MYESIKKKKSVPKKTRSKKHPVSLISYLYKSEISHF